MDYEQQLKHPLWIEKRDNIYKRDNYTCQKCGTNAKKFNDFLSKVSTVKKEWISKKGNKVREMSLDLTEYAKYKDKPNMSTFHVHHMYYVQGCMAWQYPDKALTTLCSTCHKKEHMENHITTYGSQEDANRCYHNEFIPNSKSSITSKKQALNKSSGGCLGTILLIFFATSILLIYF